MGWTVVLEDENRKPIEVSSIEIELSDEIMVKTKLLRYLDRYGDTFFNNLQLNDLQADLDTVELPFEVMDRTKRLIERCRESVHTYIVFYGD